MTLQALLFDCDGVLVDTERDGHRVAFNLAFRDAGLAVDWSVERYGELLEIAGGKERMTHFFDADGWPEATGDRAEFIKALHAAKTDHFMGLIREGRMTLRPGVRDLIAGARAADIPVAICSTSNVRAVRGIVDEVIGGDLARGIQVFAGDMVPAKKPDPAIYLLGAQTLGVDPARCVVIEDSNIGLRAAKSAGARCVVTKSTYTGAEDFATADMVTDDLASGAIDLAACEALVA